MWTSVYMYMPLKNHTNNNLQMLWDQSRAGQQLGQVLFATLAMTLALRRKQKKYYYSKTCNATS